MLPPKYPSPSTVWRRLRDWEEDEVWDNIWFAFILKLDEKAELRWAETFMDGAFAPAKKGAQTPAPSQYLAQEGKGHKAYDTGPYS